MSKRLIVLPAVLAVVATGAGCGGSADDGAALTKAQFVKQADAICKKGNESIEAGAEKFAKDNDVDTSNPTKQQKEEVITDVVAPGIRQQGEEIAALGAPSGDEGQVEAIVAAVEEGAEEIEDDPTTLIDGESPLAKSSELAKKYGLEVCGEG